MYHAASCIIMYHHIASCIIMYHHASSCIIMYHHVSSCIIMYHHVSSYCICINVCVYTWICRSLVLGKQCVGFSHVSTVFSLLFVQVLHGNDKLEEAEVAYKRAYTGALAKWKKKSWTWVFSPSFLMASQGFKKRLGLKHPKTLAALEGLAAVLRDAGLVWPWSNRKSSALSLQYLRNFELSIIYIYIIYIIYI